MGNCSNSSNEQRREREKQKLKNVQNISNITTNNEENKENFNQNTINPNQTASNVKSSFKKVEPNYYLICPDCLMRSPHIEELYYDENAKEFFVKYTCICNNLMNIKESPFLKLLTNEEPLNMCTLHQEKKLIAFCTTCKRAICSICKEELHIDHDIDMDIIRKSISKENADNMLKIIKEKEQQFNEDISKNEEKMENGINNMIQKLNEEKIKYKKQIENYKDNNIKTFDFLKNLYSRYINNFEENKNKQNINNSQINNDENYLNNNDIMLANHINNFVIKNSNILQLDTNIDEIINQYDEEQKELKLNYEFGFSNRDKPLYNSNQKIEKSIDDQKNSNINNLNNSNESIDINFTNTKIIEGHDEKIVCLIELSSGRLASGSYDKTIRIWNADYQKEDIKIKEKGRIFCLLEFEKNKILCGTSDNLVNLYEITPLSFDYIYSYIGHTLWVNCLTKVNKRYFASASNDTKIKIWDFFNRKCIKTLEGHEDCILSLITLKQSNYLCSGAADLTIKIWDWEKSKCLYTLKGHEKWVKCVIELDNGIIVSGSDDKTIKLWKDNNNYKTLKGHNNSIRSLCQINKKYFASGSFDFSIKIWEINNWKCVQTLIGHDSNIICVIALNNNNNTNKSKNQVNNYKKCPLLLASCSNDKTIKIWEEEENN